ncbi:C6 finger domain protein [Beauveria brongniartii RCEF 3172]|uniref:C6 finger domain protein n=1 Tax=Beauveria brongniartii RCEF 3172 TaxID=1081107 RepID=A0A166ZJ63_9HYPO|nr:C6 finger domain protein [Beauveria brongniartii RCEF 3172]
MTTRLREADATRQKRWAPKVRTGCQTCRIRRIKCDETQPRCKKCIARGLSCAYTLRHRPVLPALQQSWQLAPKLVPSSSSSPGSSPLVAQAEPPNWHFMEAIRYYCAFVRPIRVAEHGTHDIQDPPFHTGDTMAARFVCQIIGYQAVTVSRRRGRLVSFWEEPQFAAMRRNYSRYLVEFLGMVNRCIRGGGGGTSRAFHYLWNLLSFDLTLNESLWQAHVKGALAYAQLVGGPRAALSLPGPTIFFRQLVLQAIVSNATSPTTQQITGHLGYTDDDIKTILADEDSTRPFPVERISELRQRMQHLFRQINDFDPHAWADELDFYSGAVTPAIGRLFQLATRLYGLLSLPASMAAPPPPLLAATSPDVASLRISQRTELLACLRDTWPALPATTNMSWPLLVAGVAAADGLAEDREFVARCLDETWRSPLGDVAPLLVLEKLRAFWKSGKRGWEDCFDEPTPR